MAFGLADKRAAGASFCYKAFDYPYPPNPSPAVQPHCLLFQSQQTTAWRAFPPCCFAQHGQHGRVFCYTFASQGVCVSVIWYHHALASSAGDKSILVPLKLMNHRLLHSSFSTDKAPIATQTQGKSCLINDFFCESMSWYSPGCFSFFHLLPLQKKPKVEAIFLVSPNQSLAIWNNSYYNARIYFVVFLTV